MDMENFDDENFTRVNFSRSHTPESFAKRAKNYDILLQWISFLLK